MSLEVFLLICVVLLVSAFIKGVTGFGTSLIAIPVLTFFFLPPTDARALIVSINLILNIYILVSAGRLRYADAKPYMLLIGSVFVAAILSGFLLPRFTADAFFVLMGILLVLTALNRLFDMTFTIRHPKRYFVPLGLVGGTLNTLLGAGSVPVLIFLGNTNIKKSEFRVTVSLFLLILNAGSLISFVISNTYSTTIGLWSLVFTPVMVLGTFIGIRFQHRFNEQVFKKVVAVMLLVIGLNSIFGFLG